MHVVRGLRQAFVLICLGALVALAIAGIWWAAQHGGFRSKAGMSMLLVAACLALTGGNVLTRSGTAETNALLGTAPESADAPTGGVLTGVGIFLFVALPLFVLGGVLYGSG